MKIQYGGKKQNQNSSQKVEFHARHVVFMHNRTSSDFSENRQAAAAAAAASIFFLNRTDLQMKPDSLFTNSNL